LKRALEVYTENSGEYGNALPAASRGGHDKVVQMLLDAGADVNAQGGEYSNALQAASNDVDRKGQIFLGHSRYR
jgi:hypothetical protein